MARRVLDSNICAALVLPLPYSNQAFTYINAWKTAKDELIVPMLWEYEMVTILRKAVFGKVLRPDQARDSLQRVFALNPTRIAPTLELHKQAMEWAVRLNQASAYDAHYLAGAEAMNAEFWTADARLYSRAQQLGLDWVHVIEA
ncbi:MAG: type II toxin-antitoxin system VapC family toxin [Anaerolineae bacterium]|nr:type II toxin-antitoxin system VapC family toxin [Anaerolineae bacterium]